MIPVVRFITSLIVIIIIKDVESLTSGAAPWHSDQYVRYVRYVLGEEAENADLLLIDLHKSGITVYGEGEVQKYRNTSLKAFDSIYINLSFSDLEFWPCCFGQPPASCHHKPGTTESISEPTTAAAARASMSCNSVNQIW